MEEDTIEQGAGLRWYLGVIWHWAWLLVLVAALAGTAAYFWNRALPPVYQASTSMQIKEPAVTRGSELQALLLSERQATTYAKLITAQPLLEVVGRDLGLTIGAGRIQGMLSVQPVQDTALINLTVRDTERARATAIANKVVEVFANQQREEQAARYADAKQILLDERARLEQQLQQIEGSLNNLTDSPEDRARRERLDDTLRSFRTQLTDTVKQEAAVRLEEARSTTTVTQIEQARAIQVGPRIRNNTLLAMLIGFALALAGVFLKETLDDTVKNPEELSRLVGLPVLGFVAQYKTAETKPIVIAEPRAPIAEAFRTLRTNIQFASVDRPLHKLMVTSASPGEGKSTVISNLAAVIAQSGRRVTLVEADLRRPTLHKKLEMMNRVGISNLFVQSDADVTDAMQPAEVPGMSVVTSGELPPNPAELLGSEKMREILHQMEQHADIVLVDTPPVLAVTDALVLAQRVDGVLIVVRAGVTKLSAIKQAVEQLRFVGANTVGIVMNGMQLRGRYGYGSGYGYHGYYYAYQNDDTGDKGGKSDRGSRWRGRRSGTRTAETQG